MKLASAAMSLTPESVLLTGRLGVVTGAAQGIGAGIATTFAAFGADVAICDRDADGLARTTAEIEALGCHAHAAVLDVRDGDAVRAWVASLPAVDMLVNNAGGGFFAPLLDVNEKGQDALVREVWEETGLLVEPVRLCGAFSGPETRVRYENGDEVMYVMSLYECRRTGGELRPDGEETLDVGWFDAAALATLPLAPWAAKMLPELVATRGRVPIPPVRWRPPTGG